MSKYTPDFSHSIREPLHLILGYTRLLAKDANHDMAGKLAIIEKNALRLQQLIEAHFGREKLPPNQTIRGRTDSGGAIPPSLRLTKTLLVVDDVHENADLLHDLCMMWGYRVIQASAAADALALCLQPDCGIDAVLIDQFMPGMDGWDFLRALRGQKTQAALPVILISAVVPRLPDGWNSDIAFTHTITKPIDTNELAMCLYRLFCTTPTTMALSVCGNTILPTDKWQVFRTMLDLGQIVALRHWAGELVAECPEFGDFAAQVKRCCQSVDLVGLRRLLEQTAGHGPALE